jgi:hypothetical protein
MAIIECAYVFVQAPDLAIDSSSIDVYSTMPTDLVPGRVAGHSPD